MTNPKNPIDFIDLSDEDNATALLKGFIDDKAAGHEYAMRLFDAAFPPTVPATILGVCEFMAALIRSANGEKTDAEALQELATEILEFVSDKMGASK